MWIMYGWIRLILAVSIVVGGWVLWLWAAWMAGWDLSSANGQAATVMAGMLSATLGVGVWLALE